MNKGALFFGLSSVVSLAGVIVACSSTTTTTTTTPDEAGAKEGGTPGTGAPKDSGVVDDTDSSTPSNPDTACKAEATLQECGQCCVTNHPQGYKVFQDTLLDCSCKGTGADAGIGPCATDCAATACKATPSQPDQACTTCLQKAVGQGGGCQEALSTACTAEPDCIAEQKCVAPCQGKP
ncbi:MAG: hypothetical protein JWP87_547 [Labilithrix sp.]|nr:hypothetical protein [Labilithrix sp.]